MVSRLIRDALEEYLAGDRDSEIDRQIVASYTRRPQEDLPDAAATARAITAAEPWQASRH